MRIEYDAEHSGRRRHDRKRARQTSNHRHRVSADHEGGHETGWMEGARSNTMGVPVVSVRDTSEAFLPRRVPDLKWQSAASGLVAASRT